MELFSAIRRVAWLALGSFVATNAAPVIAQSPGLPGTPTLRSTSRNVILDVVVTDDRGRPVNGLGAADFKVTENSVQQAIRMVDVSERAELTAGMSAHGSTQQPDRSAVQGGMRTIILLDEVNVRFLDLAFARQRLEAFLRSDRAQGQPIALMTLTGRQISLVHDFTTDRAALVRAVHSIPAVLPATGEGGIISGNVDSLREMENFRHAVGVLEQISSALRGTPDRVNLLWITSGFPALTQMAASSEAQLTLDYLLRGTSNLFLEARLTLYTIDPHGVQIESSLPNHNGQQSQGNGAGATNVNTGEELLGNQLNLTNSQAVANSMLGKLDQRTGGRSFGNMNDIDVPIGMAIDEGASAYRIAYSPSDKRFDGGYRKIRVRVTRPGLVARARDGYFALAEPAAPTREDRRLRLAEALESPFLYEGLRVTARWSASQPSAVEVIVAPAGLTRIYDASGTRRKLTVAMSAYSGKNRVLGSQVWEVDATGGTAQDGAVRYTLRYPLPPGAVRLRVAVLDANGDRAGTAEVPMGSGPGGISSLRQ